MLLFLQDGYCQSFQVCGGRSKASKRRLSRTGRDMEEEAAEEAEEAVEAVEVEEAEAAEEAEEAPNQYLPSLQRIALAMLKRLRHGTSGCTPLPMPIALPSRAIVPTFGFLKIVSPDHTRLAH